MILLADKSWRSPVSCNAPETKPTRNILLAAVVLVFIPGLACLLPPVYLTLEHEPGESPSLVVDGGQVELREVSNLGRLVFEVESLEGGTNYTELALPTVRPSGRRANSSDFSLITGDWMAVPGQPDRIYSTQPGSRVRFEFFAERVEFAVFNGKKRGKIRVSTDHGEVQVVDANVDDSSTQTVRLASSRRRSIATLFPWSAPVRVEVSGSVERATVHWGLQQLAVHEVHVDPVISLPVQSWVIAYGERLVRLLVCLVSVFVLSGLAVLVGLLLLARQTNSGGDLHMCGPVGLAAFALIASSLSYTLPSRFAIGLEVLLLAGLVGLRLRQPDFRARISEIFCSLKEFDLFRWVAAPTALALFTFWPISLAPDQFIGLYQTDTGYYSELTQRLVSESLINMRTIQGFGMRILDLALASRISLLPWVTPQLAIVLVTILVQTITWPLGFALARVLGLNRRFGWTLGIVVMIWPASTALATEGYFSQFVLNLGVYLVIAAGSMLWVRLDSRRRLVVSEPTMVGFIVGTAYCAVQYPYFGVSAFVCGVSISSLGLYRGVLSLRTVGLTGLYTLLAIGPSALNVAYASRTRQFVEHLNAIARWVVFPFYDQQRFANILTGLTPFHVSAEEFKRVGWKQGTINLFLDSMEASWAFAWLFLLVFGVILWGIARRAQFKKTLIWAAMIAIHGGVLIYLRATGQIYGFSKFALTSSFVGLICVSILLGTICKANLVVARGCLISAPIFILWLAVTTILGHIPYLEHPNGKVFNIYRELAYDIEYGMRSFTIEHGCWSDDGFQYTIRSKLERLEDEQISLTQHVVARMSSLGARCSNCRRGPLFGTTNGLAPTTEPSKFTIRVDGDASGCSARAAFAGNLLVICGPNSRLTK